MNLYVFESVGRYIGGIVGVVATNEKNALHLIELKRKDYLAKKQLWEEDLIGEYPHFPNYPFFTSIEQQSLFLHKCKNSPGADKTHFMLIKLYKLEDSISVSDLGVVFCNFLEG